MTPVIRVAPWYDRAAAVFNLTTDLQAGVEGKTGHRSVVGKKEEKKKNLELARKYTAAVAPIGSSLFRFGAS